MAKCILCEANAVTSRQDYASRTIYNCPNCGVFVISDPVEKDVVANRSKLAAFLVHRHLSGSNDIVLISLENVAKDKGYVHMSVEQIVNEFPASVMSRLNMSLRNLCYESEYPGAEVRIESLSQGPIFFLETVNFESMSFAVTALEKKGLISVNYYGSSFFPCNIVVTPDGWEHVTGAEVNGKKQDNALLVVPLSLDYAADYRKAIASACRSNGYRMVESTCNAGESKIGHKTLVEARASRFLICELSSPSPEVYFLVGMAKALDKVLILTCRAKDKKEVRIDMEHKSVMLWNNTSELVDIISNAIRALVF